VHTHVPARSATKRSLLHGASAVAPAAGLKAPPHVRPHAELPHAGGLLYWQRQSGSPAVLPCDASGCAPTQGQRCSKITMTTHGAQQHVHEPAAPRAPRATAPVMLLSEVRLWGSSGTLAHAASASALCSAAPASCPSSARSSCVENARRVSSLEALYAAGGGAAAAEAPRSPSCPFDGCQHHHDAPARSCSFGADSRYGFEAGEDGGLFRMDCDSDAD
jgi:hypothetical protein